MGIGLDSESLCDPMSTVEGGISVDVCVHATGNYLGFARKLLLSLERFLFPSEHVRLLLFTDQTAAVERWEPRGRIEVVAIEVTSRTWPEATLMRFRDYADHQDALRSDLVMFLDADMEIRAEVGPELDPATWPGGVALVLHPGFFRAPSRPRRSLFRRAKSALGPRGSWESNPESLAYLPESLRLQYVCGGVWMGRRREAIGVCQELADRIDRDASNGVLAVWHDESHLNWWAAHHECGILTPEYCFAEGYPELAGLTPRIVALDKPDDFVSSVKG